MDEQNERGKQQQGAEEQYHAALEHLASGEAERAIEGFQSSLALNPHFLDAMHGLIRALQDAGRYDEGIAAALELARLDPEDVLAQTALSILYQLKGMISEAEEAGLRAKLLGWKQQLRATKAHGGER